MYRLEFICLKGLNTLTPRNGKELWIFQAGGRGDSGDPSRESRPNSCHCQGQRGTLQDDRAVCNRQASADRAMSPRSAEVSAEKWGATCRRCYKMGRMTV